MSRVFANGPGDQGSIPDRVILKTQKCYLMPPCLTLRILRYGSRVSGAIHGVVTTKKGAFMPPSTTVTNFILLYIYIYIYIVYLGSKYVQLKTTEYFLFRIFKWRCLSLITIFLMSGSRCHILAFRLFHRSSSGVTFVVCGRAFLYLHGIDFFKIIYSWLLLIVLGLVIEYV